MSKNWAYRNYLKWKVKHPTCDAKNQSPINIDTSIVADCRQTCQLEVDYRPSKCHIMNNNRTPIIKFDPNSYIIFRNEKMILHSMTMHTPSMHTVNGEFYDLEVQIYHTRTPRQFNDGGVAFCLFFKRGKETISNKNKANYFFNQFINEIPSEETKIEKEIMVGEDWNPNLIFPKTKSFFYYQGSLPRPPCKENWTWIVFEEVGIISKTNYEAFELVFENNVRPIRARNGREIFYNNSVNFINSKAKKKARVQRAITELKEIEKNLDEEIKNNKDLFLKNNIKKFIELNVSAAFHSKYMIEAQDALSKYINELNFVENKIKIISNYDAEAYSDTTSIKKNLQKQMANQVNWTNSIIKLEEIGERSILEIGPNKVLSGLINRISKNFDIKSIDKVSDL